MSIVAHTYRCVVGVDTHARFHALTIIDTATGAEIDCAQFPSSPAGMVRCASWTHRRTEAQTNEVLVSMEGTISYGTGLREVLENAGYLAVEAPRLLARGRKRTPKSDLIDAASIATRTLPIDVDLLTIPRSGGPRQALRILLGARTQMPRSNTAAINALTALVRTNTLSIDARHPMSKKQVREINGRRSRSTDTLSQSVAHSEAKRLAGDINNRWETLKENLEALDQLTNLMSPNLRSMYGVGPMSAAQFLTSWSHLGRIHSEAAFASLAGTSPIPASSGNSQRQRLNRGGDRQLNQALHNVVLLRMRFDDKTKPYVERRTKEGKSKRETMRCFKRYLAPKIHRTLTNEHTTINNHEITENAA